MSLFDGFFGRAGGPVAGAFKAAKCNTLLKLTIPRIKLLRNRREAQLKQMRREIAKLLENGQEATARIRVEHIIREENMMEAQEIIALFCELIVVRLPIIEAQKECPLDLKEAISSICFAAPRCADLPELLQVQLLFAGKYGKEFVTAATELAPDCGVNRQIIELLSVRAPAVEAKMKLLTEIAGENQVEWDPSATELEFTKPYEDLLNGPAYLSSEPTNSGFAPDDHVEEPYEEFESDEDDENADLELPEAPKATVPSPYSAPLPPKDGRVDHELPPTDFSAMYSYSQDHVEQNRQHIPFASSAPHPASSGTELIISAQITNLDDTSLMTKMDNGELPVPFPHAQDFNEPGSSDADAQNRQHAPFESSGQTSYVDQLIDSQIMDSLPSAPSQATDWKKADKVRPPPAYPSESAASAEDRSSLSIGTGTKGMPEIDLQDVLSAAQRAAERAEQAAAEARAAADTAQLRISDMMAKRVEEINLGYNNNHNSTHHQADKQGSFSHGDGNFYNPAWGSDSRTPSPYEHSLALNRSPSPSQDEDPYSYPNLFSSQVSNSGH